MNTFGLNTDQPAVYYNKLYMKNVRCFKGNHEIDFGNGNGQPSQWTVILGNNNVGKTTILRVIAGLEFCSFEDSFGYNASRTMKFDKYSTFNEKIVIIGSELFKVNANQHINIRGFQELISNSPYTKNLNQKDIEWLQKIKLSAAIIMENQQSTFPYPQPPEQLNDLKLFGYGTSRIMFDSQFVNDDNTQGIFDNKTLLLNVEEWLKELHFAANNKNKDAEKRYKQVENILCGGLLPEVTQIRITTIPDKSSFETFPEFFTSQGWVRLEDLGYGYQATLAWVADLAKRMFDQYPDLENPLHGPAVVLVDEIDLHLHPEWQRKIIKYLSDLFPNTQFIVTAHSPLIIQSAENVNLIMLEKDDNPDGKGINIRQKFGSFQGWTVDEILTELMNLGDRTRSDKYLELMQDFENAVLEDDYEKAQDAYNQLDTILSPSSYQRKVLQIQMSSLIPVGV